MVDQIERKKQILERREERIRLEKKLLKEKEKQLRAKQCIEIGQIAIDSGIDLLDRHLLLGAFLEIGVKCNEQKNQVLWKERADEFIKDRNVGSEPLSISFQADPTKEVKDKLRAAGFQWNRFRSEFVGYGEKSAVEHLLSGESFKLELL